MPPPCREYRVPYQSPYGGHAASRRIIRCSVCSRSKDVSYEDLLKYTRYGWPRCCGEVMGYFLEATRPSTNDDTDEQPALPSN
jgi:hypothetical protein